ncbi:MAG: arsenosugar biosynthesis radical SAM protein ArsS [Betaproteobacteria bacterium]|nr:arsenosugar biosynthesis radical SAM protein ArsS [Betaproteobacteria bacterium]MDH5221114.1 arsenosugar biosynthesis radical SAM protein ArsS [Betaproteobacteria bacterium]MDH5350250.1 arsenosugar biosynthesis radical SAM protein ArsS [Betaproteobacteria bacterium]
MRPASIPLRLEDIAGDLALDRATPRATQSLQRRAAPLAAPQEQLRLLDSVPLAAEFAALAPGLAPAQLDIFQVNLGKLCNMTCRHCHVDAGPDRTDAMMDDATLAQVIAALRRSRAHTVDLTGGAPELHPRFRDLVQAAVDAGKHVMDRCNLTVLLLPRNAGLVDWLAARNVEIVASLPHWRRPNTDAQRGDGVFERSVRALRVLNAAGYGHGDPQRRLTLVSNPAGAFLGASQASVEREWREGLMRSFGVTFDRLHVLNNMPIARFLEWLQDSGNLEAYLQRLVNAFNPAALDGLMCRNTLSVGWDGRLYDCDFNQMLELGLEGGAGAHIRDFDEDAWRRRHIVTAHHCFGCTAGAGSSCGGQTA